MHVMLGVNHRIFGVVFRDLQVELGWTAAPGVADFGDHPEGMTVRGDDLQGFDLVIDYLGVRSAHTGTVLIEGDPNTLHGWSQVLERLTAWAAVVEVGARDLVVRVEDLAAELSRALEENDTLERQLSAARLNIRLLDRQLEQVREAAASGRVPVLRSMVDALGSLLKAAAVVAVVGGIAEGVTSEAVSRLFAEEASEIVITCDGLLGYGVEVLPSAATQSGHASRP